MARQKKTKETTETQEVKKPVVVKAKEEVKEVKSPKKEEAKKPQKIQEVETSKKQPTFTARERLLFKNKECIFVELKKERVVVRFLDGTYSSGEKKEFSVL